MNYDSRINDDFLRAYRKLPKEIRERARESYRLFKQNPSHPSLQFKKIHASQPIYSVRVTGDYRALGVIHGNAIIWFWIGSHADYDKLLSRSL